MPDAQQGRVPERKHTVTHEVTDTDEVVIYDGSGSQLLVLNDIAAGIWLMIDGRRTIEDITGEILDHVDAERETVTRDVLAFLSLLEDRTLITWHESS
jgi:hypothetical protein